MTTHHHTRHPKLRKRTIVSGLCAVVAVLALSAIFAFQHTPTSSVEVKFTDASAHGLAIVPASCPSSPFDADSPWGCSGSTPLCADGATPAPNGDLAQCNCHPTYDMFGNIYYQCTPTPTPHGCGAGTLNDQCVRCPDGELAPGNNAALCSCAQGNAAACGNGNQGGGGNGGGGGSCPTGYTQSGRGCIFTGCPTGYSLQGTQCIFTGCPAGYFQQGTQCVLRQCSPSYQCQGNDLYYEDASCGLTFAQTCTYGCAAGACNPAPAPTGTLTVNPVVVQRNAHTVVSWSAQNVVIGSCSVTGTNGDSWGGASGSQTSGAIPAQTTYTLQCTGLDSSTFRISKVVNIVPGFCETGAPGCN
ncbi:MAG TPA: hypothetical protein VMU25_03880 [Candidatus Paceibacterota bacterium]|nr:hypothetical protein [Candidatus Paceibacterota bacterium]